MSAGRVSSPFGDPEDMAILNDETPDPNAETPPDTQEEVEDDLDTLNEDEDDNQEESEGEDEGDDEGEPDKEDEEGDPDDDEKLGNYPGRPTYGELKRYDPQLLKKFPGLKNLVFREAQFSEIFQTVDEARDAAETLTNYKAVEQQITSGDPDEFIGILGEYSEEVKTKFIDAFLPTLARNHPEAFQRATKPYIKHVLKTIMRKADNDDLRNSVLHIHNEIFGDTDLDKALTLPKPAEAKKDPKYEEERRQFYERQETTFKSSVGQETRNGIDKIIEKHADPTKILSDYDKKNVIREALESLDKVLTQDSQHMNLMGSLWNKAAKAGYAPEYQDRIKSAYLSRVRTLLPEILRKARSEALQARKGTVRRQKSGTNHRPTPRARQTNGVRNEDIDWRKSSDLDILNDNPKVRGNK